MNKTSKNLLLIGSVAMTLLLSSGNFLCAEEASPAAASAPIQTEAPQENQNTATPALSASSQAPAVTQDLTETGPEFRPEVVISQVGAELSIQANYNHPMDFANDNAIDYIRMESLSGEFLGLSSFNEQSPKATAEFMVNPKLANFDQVRLVAKSRKVGLIKSIHKLEVTQVPEPPKNVNPPAKRQTPVSQQAAPQKKKRWGIF